MLLHLCTVHLNDRGLPQNVSSELTDLYHLTAYGATVW